MLICRVVKHGNSFGIVIPKPMLKQLGWVPGDIIRLNQTDGVLSAEALDLEIERMKRRGKPVEAKSDGHRRA
jgi:antitoxin component of MazEF toxin-antitoxin module